MQGYRPLHYTTPMALGRRIVVPEGKSSPRSRSSVTAPLQPWTRAARAVWRRARGERMHRALLGCLVAAGLGAGEEKKRRDPVSLLLGRHACWWSMPVWGGRGVGRRSQGVGQRSQGVGRARRSQNGASWRPGGAAGGEGARREDLPCWVDWGDLGRRGRLAGGSCAFTPAR